MQTITPFLWFDDKAEEAARFYTSLFRNSEIRAVTRYGEAAAKAAGRPAGSTMTVVFTIDGQEFVALNGGPVFKFTEAVSFAINCETQEEIDRLWVALSDGGQAGPCGWLKDRYGLSWQIVPTVLPRFLQDPDKAKADRVMQAVLTMSKLDTVRLQQAYHGA
jgi:predicted 3-demethylubiquinone-9 3-methyltransferase (glyoxalase superfamily)